VRVVYHCWGRRARLPPWQVASAHHAGHASGCRCHAFTVQLLPASTAGHSKRMFYVTFIAILLFLPGFPEMQPSISNWSRGWHSRKLRQRHIMMGSFQHAATCKLRHLCGVGELDLVHVPPSMVIPACWAAQCWEVENPIHCKWTRRIPVPCPAALIRCAARVGQGSWSQLQRFFSAQCLVCGCFDCRRVTTLALPLHTKHPHSAATQHMRHVQNLQPVEWFDGFR
jgi:hypothetical protein